jgi:hypothetical protein
MISGVAQVIGMKPIFRSRFSSARGLSCAIACMEPIGSTDAIAARAVLAPTALQEAPAQAIVGEQRRTRAASTNSSDRRSVLTGPGSGTAPAWGSASPSAWRTPHCAHAAPRRRYRS